ncbi:MAG: hypothetical protein JW768_16350 [Chitinispirillaceae bacterium]|nr:hypothetical protein [Chitinispirillaceae bacterium]
MKHEQRKTGLSSYGRLGILLAVIGILLAIDTMADLSFIYRLWPLLTAVLGIGFIGIYLRRSRREAVYIGAGVYLIGFSGLAIYCSLTSWSVLAGLWPAFIGLMGLSFISGYFFGRRRPSLLLSGFLFISIAILFYFVFGQNQHLWWTVFIFAGISFFIFDRVKRS